MGGTPRPLAFFTPPALPAPLQPDDLSDGGGGGGSGGSGGQGNGGGQYSRQSSLGSTTASREPGSGGRGYGQQPAGFRAEPRKEQQWQGYGAQSAPEYAQWAGAEVFAGSLEGLGSQGLAGESSASAPFDTPAGPWAGYGGGFEDAAAGAYAGADVHGSFQGLVGSEGEGLGSGNNGGHPEAQPGSLEGLGLGADPWQSDAAPQIVEEELTEIDF